MAVAVRKVLGADLSSQWYASAIASLGQVLTGAPLAAACRSVELTVRRGAMSQFRTTPSLPSRNAPSSSEACCCTTLSSSKAAAMVQWRRHAATNGFWPT